MASDKERVADRIHRLMCSGEASDKDEIRNILLAGEDGDVGDALYEEWNRQYTELFGNNETRWEELLERVHGEIEQISPARCTRKPSALVRLAFGLIIAAGLMGGEYLYLTGRSALSSPGDVTLIASDCSKGSFILPDGTKVWLNRGGSLTYRSDFPTAPVREISLEGEAVFDVARTGKEFLARAGDLKVKVLGTRFGIRHQSLYDEDMVTLQSGKVELSVQEGDPVVLHPGEQAVYRKDDGGLTVRTVDTGNYCSWTGNSLDFKRKPLAEILEQLEHWYGVEFSVSEGVRLDETYSFKVPNEDLTRTMELISMLSGCGYALTDDQHVLVYNPK